MTWRFEEDSRHNINSQYPRSITLSSCLQLLSQKMFQRLTTHCFLEEREWVGRGSGVSFCSQMSSVTLLWKCPKCYSQNQFRRLGFGKQVGWSLCSVDLLVRLRVQSIVRNVQNFIKKRKKTTQEVKVMCGWPGELSLKRIIWRVCFIKYLSIDLCIFGNHILFMWSKSQCPSENHTCEKVFLCLNIIPFLIRKPTELGPLSNFLSSSVKNYYHHFLLSFSWSDNTLRGEKHSLKFLTHHGQGNHLILNALCPVQNHISEEARRD